MPADCVSIYRALSRPPPLAPPAAAAAVTRHLMLRVTDTSADSSAQLIYCQLYSERRDAWVSERWCGGGGGAGGGVTLFTDVGGAEAAEDLHCVVTVCRLGKIGAQVSAVVHDYNR